MYSGWTKRCNKLTMLVVPIGLFVQHDWHNKFDRWHLDVLPIRMVKLQQHLMHSAVTYFQLRLRVLQHQRRPPCPIHVLCSLSMRYRTHLNLECTHDTLLMFRALAILHWKFNTFNTKTRKKKQKYKRFECTEVGFVSNIYLVFWHACFQCIQMVYSTIQLRDLSCFQC